MQLLTNILFLCADFKLLRQMYVLQKNDELDVCYMIAKYLSCTITYTNEHYSLLPLTYLTIKF